MPMKHLFILGTLLLMTIQTAAWTQTASVVKVVKTATGYELQRDGKPYFIQGAGGSMHLETLKAIGGNSVRTWGGDDQTELLDTCERLGLTVSAGIWLGQ